MIESGDYSMISFPASTYFLVNFSILLLSKVTMKCALSSGMVSFQASVMAKEATASSVRIDAFTASGKFPGLIFTFSCWSSISWF